MEKNIEKEIAKATAQINKEKELIKQRTDIDEEQTKLLMDEMEKKEKVQAKEKAKK